VKILLDHCLPKRLKFLFPSHKVKTAKEQGWVSYKNGKLLAAAGAEFDVFLTVDRNIKHQQNLAALPISIIVLVAVNNRFETLTPYVPLIETALLSIAPNTLIEVQLP